MIERKNINIGDRIVQNDPEEPTDTPYKGTVSEIQECGTGPYNYRVVINLDEESMQNPYVAMCCPDGIMVCFPWTIDLLTMCSPSTQIHKP